MRKVVYNMLIKYKSLSLPAKASLWFLFCSFSQKGISVLTTPIFTRLLTKEEYGEYSNFDSWMSIITIFVTLNLTSGVFTQGLVKFDNEKKVFASSLQGLSLTLSLSWLILYLIFSDYFNSLFSLSTPLMLVMFVIMWTNSAFSFWAASQRVEYKYKMLVIVSILVSIIRPIICIALIRNFDDHVLARVSGVALVSLLFYSAFFVIQLLEGKRFYSNKFWIYALKFNIPLIPHYLSQVVLNNSDRIMIKKLVGSGQAGIYSLAYSVSLIMMIFNTSLTQTLGPWIYQKIKIKKINDIKGVAYMSLILIACLNFGLILLAPEVIRFFAPPSYYEAIWIVPPVAMSVFLIFCYELFAAFEFYFEKKGFIMLSSIGGAILNVSLNYFCIKKFGYIAAGYTTLICYGIYAIGHYLCMRRIVKEKFNGAVYDGRVLLIISGVFIILGFIAMLTYSNWIIRYLLLLIFIIILIIKRSKIVSFFKNLIQKKSITDVEET